MIYRKRTREDILNSIVDTVYRQGLNAISLNKLLELSGVSIGSFYYHFDSKQDLGHALIELEWTLLLETVLKPARQANPNPIEQVFWVFDQIEAKYLKNPHCYGCLLGNFIVDLVAQDDLFRDRLIFVFQQWEDAIAQMLHQGQSQLQPHIDPKLLAQDLTVYLEGLMLMTRLYQDRQRLQQGFSTLRSRLYNALQENPKAQ